MIDSTENYVPRCDSMEYMPYLKTAIEAARSAGALLREKWGKALHIDKKGRINVVTEADLASEQLIRELITQRFPEHEILGEEGGLTASNQAPLWIVDPLDGTTNFAQGYPFFSVSIALRVDGEIVIGVVYDPTHDELFHATKNGGAFLNNRPIHVSNHEIFEESLLVTGFPYDVSDAPDLHLDLFKAMVVKARGIRRDGSAALDMCYIASGRFDAYWEVGLHPWDIAAGLLIINEAGGMVTDFLNKPHNIFFRDLIASNGLLHSQMFQTIAPFVDRLHNSAYWTELAKH